MSTFPILYLYNPKNKRDKEAISIELWSSYEKEEIRIIGVYIEPYNHLLNR